MDRIELLSPAGDLERLKVTLLYGADAVYIGGERYSLRANATNFSFSEIKEGCDFAHKLGKKVYLTLNIVFHNSDMDGVEEYIKKAVKLRHTLHMHPELSGHEHETMNTLIRFISDNTADITLVLEYKSSS